MSKKKLGILHVHAQTHWHEEAFVVGDTAGLIQLRDAIDEALKTGRGKADHITPNDGEGFEVLIAKLDEPLYSPSWNRFAVPYTEDIASEKDPNKKHPAILWK